MIKESYLQNLRKRASGILELVGDIGMSMLPFTIMIHIGIYLMGITQNVMFLFGCMGIGGVLSVVFTDYVLFKKKGVGK